MQTARAFLMLLVLSSCAPPADARDYVFQGAWRTTNRPLDGTMTCVVTDLGGEKWQGRFYGVWQGVAFDYTVPFSGPASQLRGVAFIDGADYTWTGRIQEGESSSFQGNFGGARYDGSFQLRESPKSPQ